MNGNVFVTSQDYGICVCITLVTGIGFVAGRDLKSLFQSHMVRLFSEHVVSIFLTKKAMDFQIGK